MRGQLTIEYLFLALLALALIALSLGALLKVRDAGERMHRLELFRSTAQDVYNAGEELCAMGSGNSFSMKALEALSIVGGGEETVFSSAELNISVQKKTLCPYSDAEIPAGSEMEVRNEDGGIKITWLRP